MNLLFMVHSSGMFVCWYSRCPVTGERMNLFMVHTVHLLFMVDTVQGCLCAGTADVLLQVKG